MKRATPQSWLLHSCGRAVGRAWNRQPAWGPSSSPDCRRREGNQLSQQWASLLKSGVKGCSVVVTVQNARAALRVNHIWNIDCKNCMIQLIYLNFFSILDNSLVSGGKSQIISTVARFFFPLTFELLAERSELDKNALNHPWPNMEQKSLYQVNIMII